MSQREWERWCAEAERAEARWTMAAAAAAAYPHAGRAAAELWRSWERRAYPPQPTEVQGRRIGTGERLRRWLAPAFGGGISN